VLTVSGLVKRFGGFTAVNNVSFRVEQGEILGLIGPNGSGKSTIFNMLSGTLVPTAGSIEFDGAEIAGTAPHRIINGGIGRTFQIPRPFHRLSIFENVALAGYYGQGSHSRARANEAAEKALGMVGLSTDRRARSWNLPRRSRPAPSFCSPTRASAGSTRPRWMPPPTCCAGSATSSASPSSGSSTSWAY
jgi:ABC-type branched-subunit amino acid transport system ATPase component